MSIDGPTTQAFVKKMHGSLLQKLIADDRVPTDKRPFTLEELSLKTGISQRVLKSYKHGQSSPFDHRFLNLARELPVLYINAILGHAGLGNAMPLARDDSGQVCPNMAQVKLAEMMKALAEAMLDGRIDHIERAQLIDQLEQLISNLQLFAWGLDGPDDGMPGGKSSSTGSKGK